MMRQALVLLGCVTLTSLSGCSVAPLSFSPASVPVAAQTLDAALVTTTVSFASKEEAVGKLNTAGAEADVASLWKSTLDDSLVRMTVFRDNSPRKLSLIVKVLELDSRSLGFGARTTARYDFIDRNTGTITWSTTITSDGAASDYAGVNRVRKSASRSVQSNIEEFLRQMSAARF